MKLEEQVTSLELSKKLRELGVKQESLFHWFCPDGDAEPRVCWHHWCEPGYIRHYSAFTVAELGSMLPDDYVSNGYGNLYHLSEHEYGHPYWDYVPSETEADARAKLLIHLIEEGIINTDE